MVSAWMRASEMVASSCLAPAVNSELRMTLVKATTEKVERTAMIAMTTSSSTSENADAGSRRAHLRKWKTARTGVPPFWRLVVARRDIAPHAVLLRDGHVRLLCRAVDLRTGENLWVKPEVDPPQGTVPLPHFSAKLTILGGTPVLPVCRDSVRDIGVELMAGSAC